MAKTPEDLLKALDDLLKNPERIRDAVAQSLAEESLGLIKDEFRTETDPYGDKWKPKKRKDGRKTLSGKTSRLKTGWKITRQNRDGIQVSPSVVYADYHQNPRERERMSGASSLMQAAKRIGIGRKARPSFDDSFMGPAQLKRPRRMMVPDEERGMPPKWEKTLNEAATDTLATIFGGDGRRVSGIARRLKSEGKLIGFKVG